MSTINNWAELINLVSIRSDGVFPKLTVKINQFIRSYQKSDSSFDLNTVRKNHQEIFNNYRTIYEQLLIEDDIIDIFAEIPSLSTSNQTIVFNMVGVGKWIKFHAGNASRMFFFDDEKTMISDKSLADFLNKIEDVKLRYKFFGAEPIVYYKFKTMPDNDIVEYLKKFGVVSLDFSQKTGKINYPKIFDEKVLLDQTMMLTLCSNLSYGLSESFYKTPDDKTPDDKTKEMMVKNKENMDSYLNGKKILVNEFVYEQTKYKIDHMAGPSEKERFDQLANRVTIVSDEKNPRFYYLKDIELMSVSVAEREHAVVITGNQRLANKLDTYYQEIPYKLFFGAQLVETKYK